MTDKTEKKRLRSVSVYGLFGRYNHEFHLSDSDNVTILHGPNGVGKTALLRLLFAVFSGRVGQIFSVRFDRLLLGFENGVELQIQRERIGGEELQLEPTEHRPKREPRDLEKISIYASNSLGLQKTETFEVPTRLLVNFEDSFAKNATPYRQVGQYVIDMRTGERIAKVDPESHFDVTISSLHLGHSKHWAYRMQAVLSDISSSVDVHIIETQRLLRQGKHSRRASHRDEEGDDEVRISVNECAKELKRRINTSLSAYATESQQKDQSFPVRLLRLGQHHVNIEKLRKKLRTIAEQRHRLHTVGILVERSDSYAESFERLDLNSADDSQLRVIELYAGDTTAKLATLDRILQIARLFVEQINSKFRHKRLVLDVDKGLLAKSNTGDPIRLDELSSGEQHQLVMFYDLLFRVRPRSLVLIDEPELSLHVGWQKSLLTSLLEISKRNELDLIVATHSPYIVSGRIDLMRDLNTPEEPNDVW